MSTRLSSRRAVSISSSSNTADRSRIARSKFLNQLTRRRNRALRFETLDDRRVLATMYALDVANNVARFDSATPATLQQVLTISGLQASEVVTGIDFRPATGQMFALGIVDNGATRTGRIYTVNLTTGAATLVGGAPWSTTLPDTPITGFNFNPNVDLIRITNELGSNFRVSPTTGALVGTDTNLSLGGINGVSYTNNDGFLSTTTLYGLDFNNDRLVTIGGLNGTPSPNGGVITPVGATGFISGDVYALEIFASAGTTTAFATTDGDLYTVNLATGAFTLVGPIATGTANILGLTALPTGLTVGGTAGNDTLIVTATSANAGSYSLNGGPAVAFSGNNSFAFLAGDGTDSLTINNPAGLFAPTAGIRYHGGPGTGDSLSNLGGGNGTGTGIYTPLNATDGTIVNTQAATVQTITFTGLSPVTDTVGQAGFTINGTAAVDTINVVNGPVAGQVQVNSGAAPTFELVNFANKTNVTINATQGGADTVLINFTANATGLTTLNVNAGALNDTLNVQATVLAVVTTLNGGGGLDQINVGNTGAVGAPGLLTPIAGPVVVDGQAGGANLVVDGSGAAVAADYQITSTAITRSIPAGFGGVTYSNIGAGNDVTLRTGAGVNLITVPSTLTGLDYFVFSGDAADTVTVGPILDALDHATLTVDGQGAAGQIDTLNVDDSAGGIGDVFTVTATTVTRPVAGFNGVTYSNIEALNLLAGGGGDTINVNSTTASTATNINGGANDDAIIFANGVSLNGGVVDGGSEIDTINYAAYTTSVQVNLGLQNSLIADLDSTQENPSTGSAATATATVAYNALTRQATVSMTVNNLLNTISDFHIHLAPNGVNGGIIVPIGAAVFIPAGPPGQYNANFVANIPALNEAAFLGGVTYFNIHTNIFGSGEIRGQIIPGTNVVIPTGTATGTGGVTAVENVIGGTAADSIVGSNVANSLDGRAGSDVIVGGPGSDTFLGGNDNDTLVWNNGDGSDVMDGQAGIDAVQVNGSTTADDVFTVNPNGPRLDFDRVSPGPFSLDIGTTETLRLVGSRGNDDMTVASLDGVADLTGINLFGLTGNDIFRLNLTTAALINVPVLVQGNTHNTAGGRDTVSLNENAGVAVVAAINYTGNASGSETTVTGVGSTLTVQSAETIDYNGSAANNDAFTVFGTVATNDLLTAAPISPSRAIVFNGGNPFDGPPEVNATSLPGVSGGSTAPDLDLAGLATAGGLTIQDNGATTGDRLYVYGESDAGLSDGTAFNAFGFGAGLLLPAAGAGNAFDVINSTDTSTTINNFVVVNYDNVDFVQALPNVTPAVVVNAGFEANPTLTPATDVADIISLGLSPNYKFQVNGGDPDPATTGIVPPDGDALTVAGFFPVINVFSTKNPGGPPVVSFEFPGSGNLGFSYSSIENIGPFFTGTVNLIGDNNDPAVDQNDNFVVVGRDVDSPLGGDVDGANEFTVRINGSLPIPFSGVEFLRVYGDDQNPPPGTPSVGPNHIDTLDIRPYADNTSRGWGIETFFNEGLPNQTDGNQQDLIIYHTAAFSGLVSENIVVQPTGPDAGEIRSTNAVDGTMISTISFVANTDIEFFDDDGSVGNGGLLNDAVSDQDTLTLRGANPGTSLLSGNEQFTLNITAALGAPGTPVISVRDIPTNNILYNIREFRPRAPQPAGSGSDFLASSTTGTLDYTTIRIEPLAGNDSVTVTTSLLMPQVVDLGPGNDTLNFANISATLANTVTTTIFGGSGNDLITGSPFNDLIVGGDGDDVLFGVGGADRFEGGAGADVMVGGAGDDFAVGGSGSDTFVWNPGDADDLFEGDEGLDTLAFAGANGADTYLVSSDNGRVLFQRQPGNVDVNMGSVENIVSNSETISLSGRNEIPANASTSSGFANFTFDPVTGLYSIRIFVLGLPQANLTDSHIHMGIAGSNGPVVIPFGGGAGYTAVAGGLELVLANQPLSTIAPPAGFTQQEVLTEILLGRAYFNVHSTAIPGGELRGNIIISGTTAGSGGADTLTVRDTSGTDLRTVVFEAGNEAEVRAGAPLADVVTVEGRNTPDAISASVPNTLDNNYLVSGLPYNIFVNGSDGLVANGVNADLLTINGNGGNDGLQILAGVDSITRVVVNGGDGFDSISGNGTLNGGADNDYLVGGDAAQTISGDAGDDVIHGGGGDDILNGGLGEDLFVGGAGADTIDGGADFDTILVTGTSGNDLISINQSAATTLVHTVNGDAQTDTLVTVAGVRTVESVRVEAGAGADAMSATWLDSLGTDAVLNSLRIDVVGGPDFAFDRLGVLDNGTGDLLVYRKGALDTTGTVTTGPANAEPLELTFEHVEVLQPVAAAGGQIEVFKHDPYEFNDAQNISTHLGAGSVINVDPTIDPGALAALGLPADQDFFRVEAQHTGTLDFSVFFNQIATVPSGRPGLPGNGDLNIEVRDAAGNIITGFGANDATNNERVRIPVVQGQLYFLRVFGATGAAVNVYSATIINTPAPLPFDLELDDDPANGTTNPPGQNENSDTGRSQDDNITYDNTPTIIFRVADSELVADIPDNSGNPGLPVNGVRIPINFVASTAANAPSPGFRVAVFRTEANTRIFVGYAASLGNGLYSFTFPAAIPEGSHFISARVEMIDPTTPEQNQGFGGFATEDLEIRVDISPPPAAFGFAAVLNDGLAADSDTGILSQSNTFVDRITADATPTFWGEAEANSIVRIYADRNNDGLLTAADVQIAMTVALPYDGTNQYINGHWEATSLINLNDPTYFGVKDGLRTIFVTAEDVAGNVTAAGMEVSLELFLDTQGPQVDGVTVTGSPLYDLFDPKPSTDGPTPLVNAIDIEIIDQPPRGAGGGGGFADIVVIMDESGSMGGEHDFIDDFITALDTALAASGIGDGVLGFNQFGLVGYGNGLGVGNAGRTFLIGGNQMGSAADFAIASTGLVTSGGTEDGYEGVNFALTNYALRANATKIFVLVTDEDRDVVNAGLTFGSILAGMQAADVGLVTILDEDIQAPPNITALALDASANAYIEQPAGAFQVIAGGTVVSAEGTSIVDYVNLTTSLNGVTADLNQLRLGGNTAVSFGNSLVQAVTGIVAGGFFYPAINETLATTPGLIQVRGDYNGIIPIQSIEFIDHTMAGDIGRTTLRVHFFTPLPDDRFTLTIDDALKDQPGNPLDGESNASEPQESPFFPSGNGDPGGDFVGRFTVDTRPELGVWATGSAWIDTNGNQIFDQDNLDYTNRDIAYLMGYTADKLFAGNFAPTGAAAADGFDKLAAYGRVGTTWRWQIDTDNDGVPNIEQVDPAAINGFPVAGDFGAANEGDEVGLFTGNTWHLDLDHDFILNDGPAGVRVVSWPVIGYGFTGDFDGDGAYDLGTWTDDTFQLSLSSLSGGLVDGTIDRTFFFGFAGARELPVAADMNMDGIDDIGLWNPDRATQIDGQAAEWYWLISGATTNDTPPGGGALGPTIAGGLGEVPVNGRIVPDPITLGRNLVKFTPTPFGNDLYMQYGDEFALPIVGNFDPPVATDTLPPPPNTNTRDPLDVNNDGKITAFDALEIINQLNLHGGPYAVPTGGFVSAPFLNADGNNVISAFDALQIINWINLNPVTSGSAPEATEEAIDRVMDRSGGRIRYDDRLDDSLLEILAEDRG